MRLFDLEDRADFSPVSHPHRKLQKLWAISDEAVAALNENIELLCLRGDMEVVPTQPKPPRES